MTLAAPSSATPIRDRLESKLRAGLAPETLIIRDDSRKHAGHGDRLAALAPADQGGHAPIDGAGETHFSLDIVSARFSGMSRLERQRLVNALVAEELRERVHALSLRCRSPEEQA
ncbi:transcriptional regulator BolA [Rhodospirillum rubrum F11]|uniref:Transcriptional regulator BolA n=1 Tax=Rhodospirillum rubrum (strain ATCC 11170 / ATH 1.1.1 / DSM 467 / LMG 4362 / NCIMB 8255 / S1) TaxID=269796 RepID=Q2RXY6_RHORT|nr:BolA family protein [Rhodospirillum rubrum]ABC21009.1 transcriptional regulator BolA [Rhodospirillum rubrum ATCC 11170]AEO46674.1 transcriptional regulator BolA [Rhodospirillum rubrum F11]QXG80705.1 BolA family transcriptional regulator [Rhodospirillum rubrum]